MKRSKILGGLVVALVVEASLNAGAEARVKTIKVQQPFTAYVLAEGLDSPWDIEYGPDNLLWLTERLGKKILTIDPATGKRTELLTIDEAFAGGGHQGVLGLALEPGFLQTGSQNYLYVLYTYQQDGADFKKVVRYQYDVHAKKLINPTAILTKIPAGTDHNGGRMVFGPDGMLYISTGELGHNQFGSFLLPIEAQRLPTAEELAAGDYSAYVGKTLRITPDGSIPEDNPVLDGIQSHIFTLGHRNPQGLAFVGDRLFSVEHGPSSDDELNLLEAGGNYGWPHVAGFRDNAGYRYINWSEAKDKSNLTFDANVPEPGVPVYNETDWPQPANYKDPLKTFFTVRSDYDFHDSDLSQWPTIAPSSVAYYPENGGIPGWDNSLLITTLKNGAIYKVKLNNAKNNVQGDVEKLFKTQNRYRDLVISPDHKTIYVITDGQNTAATDYNLQPTAEVENPGSVLVFKYRPQK